jgi:hypothetical protein
VPAFVHVGQQLRMSAEEGADALGHVGAGGRRCGGDGFEGSDRAQQAGLREVLLLAVVVGHAVGDEADAARNVGQRRALQAVFIEQQRGRGQDRLTLLLEAQSGR